MSEKMEETTELDVKTIALHLEAVLFVSNQAIAIKDLLQSLKNAVSPDLKKANIQQGLEYLQEKYESEEYAFHLVEITKGFQFLSKDAYHRTISSHLNIKAKKRLSKAAMETLAIIAYKQPVTKAQIEEIRGVNSDYGVQKLLEKELIAIVGRSDKIGKPLLYGTSPQFMDHFGLKSIKDLPKLKEVIPQHNQIGDNTTEEEVEEQGTLDLQEKEENSANENGEMVATEDIPIVENGEESTVENVEESTVENVEESTVENVEGQTILEEEVEPILEDEIEPVLENEEDILEDEIEPVLDNEEDILEDEIEPVLENEEEVLEEAVEPVLEDEEEVLEEEAESILENEEEALEDEGDSIWEEEGEVILEEAEPITNGKETVWEEESATEPVLENEDNLENYEGQEAQIVEETNGQSQQEEVSEESNEDEKVEETFDETTE